MNMNEKSQRRIFHVCAGVFLLTLACLTPLQVNADSTGLTVTAPSTVSQGDNFIVGVDISNVTDLDGFQFDLSFDPSVLQVTDVLEGTFLSTSGSTFFLPGSIDNTSGNVLFNADALLGPGPGANGSGVLVEFEFDALAPGSSSLGILNVILVDSLGNAISNSATPGSVNITGATVAAPEPASWILLCAGLGVLMWNARPARVRRIRSGVAAPSAGKEI